MFNTKNYSVLYAEDEAIIRMNIENILKKYFLKVFTACDGNEAVEFYNEKLPDALILDISMPKKTGLEVASLIRKKNKSIPIIFLTAYTDTPMLLKAIDLQIDKYLVKPIQVSELEETLKKMLLYLLKNDDTKLHLSHQCMWDKSTETLYLNRKKVPLTFRELKLFNLLHNNYMKSMSMYEIIFTVWEDKAYDEVSKDSVKKLISNLRKKLPKNCLVSVYGEGYMLRDGDEEGST